MTFIDFILLLLIAGIAGSIGQAIAGYSRGGCLVSISLGFIGALIGMWLARELSLPTWLTFNIGNTAFPFLWAVIGSSIVVLIVNLIARKRL